MASLSYPPNDWFYWLACGDCHDRGIFIKSEGPKFRGSRNYHIFLFFLWRPSLLPCLDIPKKKTSLASLYDAVSTDNAIVCAYVTHDGWSLPASVSMDLIDVGNSWPNYAPNREVEFSG